MWSCKIHAISKYLIYFFLFIPAFEKLLNIKYFFKDCILINTKTKHLAKLKRLSYVTSTSLMAFAKK
jgi:hypothetical protein